MNLSNVSKIRFNKADVKLAKIDGVIIYGNSTSLKARYTANASGVVPAFNDGYVYEVNEVESNGVYTVEITSENDFSRCSFRDKSNLLTVEYLEVTDKVTSMVNIFSGCKSLTSLDLSGSDTSNVNNTAGMFYNCNNLTSLDLSGFDTSNVTNMLQMFSNCRNLTSLDLSSFDTSKVTSMANMFVNCNNLTSLDLSGFNTSKVTSMTNMFSNCRNLTSLDSMMNISADLNLPSSLNQESILDVVNNLSAVSSTKTLTISVTQLSWISEDKIIEANNKGWTISA